MISIGGLTCPKNAQTDLKLVIKLTYQCGRLFLSLGTGPPHLPSDSMMSLPNTFSKRSRNWIKRVIPSSSTN